VGPNFPSGREAGAAWRALSPEGRAAAWAAAKTGTAPGDLGVAWAAAGRGRSGVRQLRTVLILGPFAFMILLIATTVIVLGIGVGATDYLALLPLLLLGYIAGMVTLRLRLRRYQRLYDSGTLAIEAARTVGVAQPPGAGVWTPSSYQSEFTVPYQASVPVAMPAPRPAPDPTATGTREVTVRRGQLAFRLTITLVFSLLFPLLVFVEVSGPGSNPVMIVFLIVLALVYLPLALFTLVLNVRFLVNPLIARFSPAGWELPYARMAGPWSGVREIRVRATSARVSTSSVPTRVVVLVIDAAAEQVARTPVLRRYLFGRTTRRYGSPAVILAGPRSMPVSELIPLLQRYTAAPISYR